MLRLALLSVIALASLTTGCKMSDRDYCEKRQMAWDRAFPHEPPSADEHEKFIRACAVSVAKEHASGDFDRRVKCLNDNVKGVHANVEYDALVACEGGLPAPDETGRPKPKARP